MSKTKKTAIEEYNNFPDKDYDITTFKGLAYSPKRLAMIYREKRYCLEDFCKTINTSLEEWRLLIKRVPRLAEMFAILDESRDLLLVDCIIRKCLNGDLSFIKYYNEMKALHSGSDVVYTDIEKQGKLLIEHLREKSEAIKRIRTD